MLNVRDICGSVPFLIHSISMPGLKEEVLVFSLEQLSKYVPDGWPWWPAASDFFLCSGRKLRLYPSEILEILVEAEQI